MCILLTARGDYIAKTMRILLVSALAAMSIVGCSSANEVAEPLVTEPVPTTEPCLTAGDVAYVGGELVATTNRLIPCKERIETLEERIPPLAEAIAEWPMRYRAEAVFTCENDKWAAPDMGYDSFEHCIEVQLYYDQAGFELADDEGRLRALREELLELRDRIAGS